MKTNYTTVLAMVAGFGLGAVAVQVLHAQATPPAYTVAEVEVTDPETYKQYIAVGVPPWESLERAKAFYESEEYKRVIPIRDKSSNFRAYVIEGVVK